MGKSRRNRNKDARSDPIAKPVKPLSDPELVALRDSRILPVVKDLKSPDSKSRTAAAGAIANIVQDAKCRKLLLREQIVQIVLTETLTDNSLESRAAGWNILRVLAQEEDSDFCVHLFRLDILTAVEFAGTAVVVALNSSSTPFTKMPKAHQDVIWEIAGCLVFLIGALAVARDEILQAVVINRSILRFLFVLLLVTSQATSSDLLDEVLSCLMTLSEESLEFGQALVDDQETHCYRYIVKLASSGGTKAMLACGVLHNVYYSLEWQDGSPGLGEASDALLIREIAEVLEKTKLSGPATNGNHGQGPADVLQIAFEVLASIGSDFQSALERGNNAGNKSKPKPNNPKAEEEWSGIEDGDPMDEDEGDEPAADDEPAEEEDESDDEMDQDELEEDMDLVTGVDEDETEESTLDDLPTLKKLIQLAVPQCIKWSQIPLDSDDAIAVQGHAFSALNNIAWTVSCFDFTNDGNQGVYRSWAPVAKKIWLKSVVAVLASDTADLKLATAVTSLAWAISRSLGGNTPLNGDEHRRFMALYQASKSEAQQENAGPSEAGEGATASDPFQALGVKCIGVLGQLARDPASIELNREIGIFLITVLSGVPATPAADAIEALNQLFDMYGDESYACDRAVFYRHNFLKHLEELVPKVKAMAKGIDKRQSGELRERADEVLLNLNRFLGYKRKNAPK